MAKTSKEVLEDLLLSSKDVLRGLEYKEFGPSNPSEIIAHNNKARCEIYINGERFLVYVEKLYSRQE